MSTKITSFEMENVKRVRAVKYSPAQTGLTTLGGNNAQGKTSILDGIVYALGGEKYRPSGLQRVGGVVPANVKIELSNGVLVERSGKNATLKVTDPNGGKSGQRLLDEFIEELALNLPKFLNMKSADKAKVLLQILGIEQELKEIDEAEKAAYDERTVQGRIADQKEKYAAEMPEWHNVPEEPLTSGELVAQSQQIMQRNAERQAARENIQALQAAALLTARRFEDKEARVKELAAMLDKAKAELAEAEADAVQAAIKAEQAAVIPVDENESTAEIEARLNELEEINGKIRANSDKQKAINDAEDAREVYRALSAKVEAVRERRRALLASVRLPLPELSVEAGELVYKGQQWDCMSGMEQVRVACAIVRRLKPECGFVLLDKLEGFDTVQLGELGAWLEAEGLQAIATRVSTGEECSIIIEDGMIAGGENRECVDEIPQPPAQDMDW